MRLYYTYLLARQRNGTLYVGSAADLVRRVGEHKNKVTRGFTEKNNVNQLVYYKMHEMNVEAATQEKCFKNGCRKLKLNLIEEFNPTWRDLYQDICS